ncbi:hypothetical protein CXB51_028564 [Gossypium anomalum]|uniref:Uncharacterized protein n=1 Tax=Gossypium anomalum TaxID=47600 RepID=A0A8J5YH87_9ROSI|nr:hypothetical protein CXB51_028564 [Gossypium anomalum]
MGKGCRLDTRKRVCGKLGLSVDGPIVIGLVVVAKWRDVCEQLLGRVLDTIYRAQIDMNWLKRNFGGLDTESSEVQREQHPRVYILMIIEGSPNAR